MSAWFTEERPATLAVVGNAPEMGDRASEIDSCDMVLRFNNAAGFGGRAGERVTHLALVNRGGQPREWLEEGFGQHRAVGRASEVILPFPPLEGDTEGVCATDEMMAALAEFPCRVRTLSDDLHRAAHEALRHFGAEGRPNPSTGFLLVFHLLAILPPTIAVEIFGFGFQGWPGHPWEAERRWFEAADAEGRLKLWPLLEMDSQPEAA